MATDKELERYRRELVAYQFSDDGSVRYVAGTLSRNRGEPSDKGWVVTMLGEKRERFCFSASDVTVIVPEGSGMVTIRQKDAQDTAPGRNP